jgi:hypothetical protein
VNLKNRLPNLFSKALDNDLILVALASGVYFLYCYLTHEFRPTNTGDIGWFAWADQSLYLKQTKALSEWSFQPHYRPLGYPLLGAIFYRMFGTDAFMIPNLVSFVAIAVAFYGSCRSILTRLESVFLTAGLICTQYGIIWKWLIVPWNNIPAYAGFFVLTWLVIFRRVTTRSMIVAAIVMGYAFFCRPETGPFLLIIYSAGLLDLKSLQHRIQLMGFGVLSMCFFFAIESLVKIHVSGALISGYETEIAGIAGHHGDLPFRLYQFFLDGASTYAFPMPSLLARMPWIIFSIVGIFVLSGRTHGKIYLWLVAMLSNLAFGLSLGAMVPPHIYWHAAIRYILWIVPWLGFLGYVGITRSWKELGWRKVGLVTGSILIIILSLGIRDVTIAEFSAHQESTSNKTNVQVETEYDDDAHVFSATFHLKHPDIIRGISLEFSKSPSNIDVDFCNLRLIIDGSRLSNYSDYLAWSYGDLIMIGLEKSYHSTPIKTIEIQISKTRRIDLLESRLTRAEFVPFGILDDLWRRIIRHDNADSLTCRNDYTIGRVIDCEGIQWRYGAGGWGHAENGFIRTHGYCARLELRVRKTDKPMVLRMNMRGLTDGNVPAQQVTVVVNGEELGEWKVKDAGTYSVAIPGGCASIGVLLIELKLGYPFRPVGAFVNNLARGLCLSVQNMVVDYELNFRS